MTSLLRMKPWVLSLLLIMPLFFQIITVADGIMALAANEGPEQDKMLFSSMILLGLTVTSAIVSTVILFGWLYTIATRLYPKLPQYHQLKIGRFRFAFFFPVIYIVAAICFIFAMVSSDAPKWIFVIVPLHIFAMVCLFYVLYYTAKSLKTVELQRRVNFGDYAGEFFLLWFWVIGVWFIQPRINTIFANDEPSEYGGPVDRYLK
jgi:hypothetical protein